MKLKRFSNKDYLYRLYLDNQFVYRHVRSKDDKWWANHAMFAKVNSKTPAKDHDDYPPFERLITLPYNLTDLEPKSIVTSDYDSHCVLFTGLNEPVLLQSKYINYFNRFYKKLTYKTEKKDSIVYVFDDGELVGGVMIVKSKERDR